MTTMNVRSLVETAEELVRGSVFTAEAQRFLPGDQADVLIVSTTAQSIQGKHGNTDIHVVVVARELPAKELRGVKVTMNFPKQRLNPTRTHSLNEKGMATFRDIYYQEPFSVTFAVPDSATSV